VDLLCRAEEQDTRNRMITACLASKIRQNDTGPVVGSNVAQIFRRLISLRAFSHADTKDTPENITQ